ncbi:hypothetical protein KGQ24_04050 [Patescibacteria group bacterium]|nr:hypothetical protein [Patescibacteria group bacterium]
MAEIIPAILEENWEKFSSRLNELLKIPYVKTLQVDFSDGKFTPHTTIAIGELDLLNPAYKWEAHIMASDPRSYFFDAKLVGFTHLIFHFEAAGSQKEASAMADEIEELKMVPVIAINPETNPEEISGLLERFSQVLVLGVHPGYQGAEFVPETVEKVAKLRAMSKDVIIEVDGGVKTANIGAIAAAGADKFVIGSALYEGSPDITPAQNFEKFALEIKNK